MTLPLRLEPCPGRPADGWSSKPKRDVVNAPVFVPHADDAAEVREAFDEARRDELLSAEESEAYLRELLGNDDEAKRGQ